MWLGIARGLEFSSLAQKGRGADGKSIKNCIYVAICYIVHMHRTTILLPENVRKAAQKEARKNGISLGELIRRRLVSGTEVASSAVPLFFRREVWTGATPRDLSERHDEHLYGI